MIEAPSGKSFIRPCKRKLVGYGSAFYKTLKISHLKLKHFHLAFLKLYTYNETPLQSHMKHGISGDTSGLRALLLPTLKLEVPKNKTTKQHVLINIRSIN